MKPSNTILFDGCATQGTLKNKYHGGGEYAKFILRKSLEEGKTFDIVFNKNKWTDPEVLDLIKKHDRINILWVEEKNDIYKILKDASYKKYYSALPYQYVDFNNDQVEFIGVIHGLRQIELPTDKYSWKYSSSISSFIKNVLLNLSILKELYIKIQKRKFRRLLNIRNSKFICVSNHTKYSILNQFPEIDKNRFMVFYSPMDLSKNPGGDNPKENYILMCNGNRPEKNVYRAIKVLDKLFTDGKLSDYKIMITGCHKGMFNKSIINREKFVLLPYVTKEELDNLFMKAFCFIYPSLNEGFGYPPIQAMNCNVPVIASSSTSIPEVCGDGALFFDSRSQNDLASRILYLINDSEAREQLVEAGGKRVLALRNRQEREIEANLSFIFD